MVGRTAILMYKILLINRAFGKQFSDKIYRVMQIIHNMDEILAPLVGVEQRNNMSSQQLEYELPYRIASLIGLHEKLPDSDIFNLLEDNTDMRMSQLRAIRAMSDEEFEQWLKTEVYHATNQGSVQDNP